MADLKDVTDAAIEAVGPERVDGKDVTDAAVEAVEPERLLDGEDPHSQYPEDALHWRSVYEQLLEYKRDLLGRTEGAIDDLLPEASRELEQTDLVVLTAERDRLERRLAFWTARAQELGVG